MCWECWSEGVEPSKWAQAHVKLDTTNASRQAPCQLTAAAVLPLTPRETFELLTHPENCAIFKGIDRCTYRRILADDGDGLQEVEVENESGAWPDDRIDSLFVGLESLGFGSAAAISRPPPSRRPATAGPLAAHRRPLRSNPATASTPDLQSGSLRCSGAACALG